MAEWSIAAVLKTVEVRASGGSNPSLSAIYIDYHQIHHLRTFSRTIHRVFVRFLFFLHTVLLIKS